ncbi:MAG TPA: zinc-ribbon domain-containing protein [Kofleriaceae bacterium]|jgi:predicted Zn finger-like uncharacterized protein|nr:zinc-ribbon domain-containing protein [Kofleriaceae bacterium]
MDVRCEKCQTEYELDESRLKPGGVTVKCTNCGHMFKIRKRTPTNVGLPTVDPNRPRSSSQNEAPTVRAPMPSRADSVLGDAMPSAMNDPGSGPTERNWLVRLENGEQKTCRELATLQQWIVAGVATRESLISRSGKTWKRLGDITELGQYFSIADEARTQRAGRPTPRPSVQPKNVSAAGGTVLPDDPDDEAPTTTRRPNRATPPPPPQANRPDPRAATELAPTTGPGMRAQTPPSAPPPGRQTAAWASSEIKPTESIASMPQGPRGGNFSAAAAKNEPMFAGRVRMDPGDESSFDTGRVKLDDDDPNDAMNRQRGSRAGTWIAIVALLVIAGGAGAVYMLVFDKHDQVATAAPKDAAAVAAPSDAALVVQAGSNGSAVAPPVADPLDAARAEIANGVEPRLKGAYDALADKTDGPSLAMRARLGAALSQSQLDRAVLDADKADADKLRKAGKQLAIDVSAIAQKALKARADDPWANLAMADVLRLQGKSAHEVDRYLQVAKTKGADDKDLARAVALAAAQTDARDSYYDDALKDLKDYATADDPRVRIELALIAFQQGKPADARPLVDQVLSASPDHDVARAIAKRLETVVAKTDPMPAEDHEHGGRTPPPQNNGGDGGGDYDTLVAKAGKLAESNCPRAMEIYQNALVQKPTGVEALTGIGYCYLDAKQFSSAFSKFRTALAVSQRYEPALAGIAETYQQQGNKDQAIASWRAYLEAFPGSAKAKKQLEILGATEGGDTGPAASGSATPPVPAPTPAPPGADGSSSG